MFKEERYQYILNQLEKNGRVVGKELAIELKVSVDTVLRDLNELSKNKKLLKVHGGALPMNANLSLNQWIWS